MINWSEWSSIVLHLLLNMKRFYSSLSSWSTSSLTWETVLGKVILSISKRHCHMSTSQRHICNHHHLTIHPSYKFNRLQCFPSAEVENEKCRDSLYGLPWLADSHVKKCWIYIYANTHVFFLLDLLITNTLPNVNLIHMITRPRNVNPAIPYAMSYTYASYDSTNITDATHFKNGNDFMKTDKIRKALDGSKQKWLLILTIRKAVELLVPRKNGSSIKTSRRNMFTRIVHA